MLPNIPKLVMVASIDDITSVPSLKSRVSSSNAEGSRWSTSDESKRRYWRALWDYYPKLKGNLQRDQKTNATCHLGNGVFDSTQTISSKRELLWGHKRKGQIQSEFKSDSIKSGQSKPPRGLKRHYKTYTKQRTVKSFEWTKLSELEFSRKRTYSHNTIFSDYWLEKEVKESFKNPLNIKRTRSMHYVCFSLCPPKPLNTTRYIIKNMAEDLKLPWIDDCNSSENYNDWDVFFDENSPDTYESMTGKLNAFWIHLKLFICSPYLLLHLLLTNELI